MKKTSYQDAHLDLLIRMTFEQLDEEDTEQLAASPDPELNAADALRADKAFDTACSKVGIQEKQEKNQTGDFGFSHVYPLENGGKSAEN